MPKIFTVGHSSISIFMRSRNLFAGGSSITSSNPGRWIFVSDASEGCKLCNVHRKRINNQTLYIFYASKFGT